MESSLFGSAAESKFYLSESFIWIAEHTISPRFPNSGQAWVDLDSFGSIWVGIDLDRFGVIWTDFGAIRVSFELHARNYQIQTDLDESFRTVVLRPSYDEI